MKYLTVATQRERQDGRDWEIIRERKHFPLREIEILSCLLTRLDKARSRALDSYSYLGCLAGILVRWCSPSNPAMGAAGSRTTYRNRSCPQSTIHPP